jgi:hypothetical protein
MTILVTGPGTFHADVQPEVGKLYSLESAESGTGALNRAFHGLVTEYWKSGAWSYPGSGYREGMTFNEFRDTVKKNLGAGFESYVYVTDEGKFKKAKRFDEIPENIRKAQDRRDRIMGRLKSWSDYSKVERKRTIDNVLSEMDQVGVNTPKYREILAGMSKLWEERNAG